MFGARNAEPRKRIEAPDAESVDRFVGARLALSLFVVNLAAQSDEVRVFGIRLVGLTPATARKLALTVALVALLVVLRLVLRSVLRPRGGREQDRAGRVRFWTQQAVALLTAAVLVLGVVSIWFETPQQLTGVLGLVAAGVAIALQRVITAFAAYLIILRGRVFTVGDRIVMAGVRGDVIALGFMQTTIMEMMGQPPPAQSDPPAQWVHARQYTGRIVRVTNDKIDGILPAIRAAMPAEAPVAEAAAEAEIDAKF